MQPQPLRVLPMRLHSAPRMQRVASLSQAASPQPMQALTQVQQLPCKPLQRCSTPCALPPLLAPLRP